VLSCSACRTVRAGSHPDVRAVVPEGLSISVDEMRAVVAAAARRPALGRWQIVVIEDADRLTERASNALLKAVEEPAPRTVFLLCAPSSHPDDVSVTIRSRCRLLGPRTPPPAPCRSRISPPSAGSSSHSSNLSSPIRVRATHSNSNSPPRLTISRSAAYRLCCTRGCISAESPPTGRSFNPTQRSSIRAIPTRYSSADPRATLSRRSTLPCTTPATRNSTIGTATTHRGPYR